MSRKRTLNRFLVLFAALCSLSCIVVCPASAAKEPPLRKSAASWKDRVIAAYCKPGGVLPDLRTSVSRETTGKEQALRLITLYSAEKPGSLPATAIAYWGAMRLAHPDPWVIKMTQAGTSPARTGRKMGEESVGALPEALEQVYQKRKNRAALEALIRLQLDGGPAETLSGVRNPLFLQYPEAFAVVLIRKPINNYQSELHEAANTFTTVLAFDLQRDVVLRKSFARLRQKKREDQTQSGRFIYRYLTLVLDQSQIRAERFSVKSRH